MNTNEIQKLQINPEIQEIHVPVMYDQDTPELDIAVQTLDTGPDAKIFDLDAHRVGGSQYQHKEVTTTQAEAVPVTMEEQKQGRLGNFLLKAFDIISPDPKPVAPSVKSFIASQDRQRRTQQNWPRNRP